VSTRYRRFAEKLSGRSFERSSRLTTSPGHSLWKLGVKRLRVLLRWVIETMFEFQDLAYAHRITRRIKDQGEGRRVLIIAGGPSTKNINIEEVNRLQRLGELDLIAVNSFALSALASEIEPDIYVLGDPLYLPNSKIINKGAVPSDVWEKFNDWKELKLVLPHNWIGSCSESFDRVIAWYDNRELVGFSDSISPVKPRGYISVVTHTAIAVALYMGYDEVLLLGFDNSIFKQLQVDDQNNLFEGPGHFYETHSTKSWNINNFFPNGMADALYAYGLIFYDLKTAFSSEKITNLDVSSYADSFRKQTSSNLVISTNR
jgi:hypothetical protein